LSEPLSLYIHIPFCVKKCGYCDFYSITDLSLTTDYISGLVSEIRMRADKNQPVQTIYFGGGTPSVMGISEIHTLLETLSDHFDVAPDAEVTMEINPGTIDRDYLIALKNKGINRLSIGVQSFNDQKLTFLTRIHSSGQAQNALNLARKAGFDNIGMDLMYGIPNETVKSWQQDLDQAAGWHLPHLSCYMLTLEPDTPLFNSAAKKQYCFPGAKEKAGMFTATSAFLEDCGYIHYEISNFARSQAYQSRHNTACWNRQPYMGFGAGAHSFAGMKRSWNHADIHRYLSNIKTETLPVVQTEILTIDQQLLEILMLGLRTSRGIDIQAFDLISDQPFTVYFKELIRQIQENRWGTLTADALVLTLEGRTFLNPITALFANAL
jgi:oxygen-independent coproporphyrinogen-3 oxidase